MELDVRGRQGGKTHDMLEWMKAAPPGEHRVIVSHSAERSMQLYRSTFEEDEEGFSRATWAESWQFVCTPEVHEDGVWLGVLHGRGGRIVLGIDDLDIQLQRMFGRWEIGRVTWSGVVGDDVTVSSPQPNPS